ncbi:VOC family protein [Brooklawnia cerclae]|uniref:PhnB protein n=1 Tax=Brooklawnia cerclae TaxID=349934 RepID=A0ABX0SK24_9ACTN|nr:VOC family protein [Brooklawnia cerclae]NIH58737.1 PhnB protein [Brooklawnia cerclae]
MLTMHPYLSFNGNAREATTFYQEVFGGKLTVSTFGEYGADGMPPEGVMHAELATDHFVLYASDAFTGSAETWRGQRIALALMGDEPGTDLELATRWFDRLAVDGTIGQPLAEQLWGDVYGQVTDKYGIDWMVDVGQAGQG